MAEFKPFRAIRYDAARISNLAAVVAPPYDVISPEVVSRLYDRDPYNVVRLILNRNESPHVAAARDWNAWRRAGVLTEDQSPAFYFYSQTFECTGRGVLRRDGIIGQMRLEDYRSGRVLPHERTHQDAKDDRLRLVKACRANLSPIFGIVSRPGMTLRDVVGSTLARPPDVDMLDPDDTAGRHQLWRIGDPGSFAACADIIRNEPVVIADGHHRYETALDFCAEMSAEHPGAAADAPFRSVLTCISNIDEPGLVVLPTHRILPSVRAADVERAIRDLGSVFDVTTFRRDQHAAFLAEVEGRADRIGCALGDELVLLRLRVEPERLLPEEPPATRRLAVVLLHAIVLPRLPAPACERFEYTHEGAHALSAVADGRAGAAFLVPAPTAQDVRDVCLTGKTMPQKSTYFYPKLLTGLVFHSLAPSQ